MDLPKLISDQTDVSLAMANHVFSTEAKESNFAFSPLSIHVVLSLLAAASDAKTQSQLLSFLKSNSTEDLNKLSSELVSIVFADGSSSGGPKLSFANGVWIDKSLQFLPAFKQILVGVYKAAANQVDFQTEPLKVTAEVNSWAEKETGGLIKDVLPPGSVDSTTRVIFANALYFKGAWDEKFDASKTEHHDFHLLSGTPVKVPFMTSEMKQLISTFDDFKVLGLRYKKGEDKRQFSMYILLPDAKDGLAALAHKVSSVSGFLDQHLPYERVKVGDFRVPRFKILFGFEASKVLKGLGVTSIFSGGGLTRMVSSPVQAKDLYVSGIFHKAFVEVNEEGTRAGAASAAVVNYRSVSFAEKVDFVADHPFLFVIREDVTGVVLFTGHVLNPLAG